jgi:hypothetical protein
MFPKQRPRLMLRADSPDVTQLPTVRGNSDVWPSSPWCNSGVGTETGEAPRRQGATTESMGNI